MDYKDILQQIKDKDPKGLEELYQAYGSRFYAYAVQRWKCSEDEAWEVVYRTLETLILKLSNYEFKSKSFFEGFLFKVLVNFLRQSFRQKRSRHADDIDFVDLNNEVDIPYNLSKQISKSAFVEYYRSESVDNPALLILNEALSRIDPVDKDILLLRAQDYSYEEVAKMLNLENNQLKVRHFRAKQKLTTIFNEIKNNDNG